MSTTTAAISQRELSSPACRSATVWVLPPAVVRAGERHDVATPLNRALLVLLRAISDAAASGRAG